MMNVGIVFWAANATGDEVLREIAAEHCRTTARHLVRADGGTAHEGIFDLDTGRFLRQTTHQGWNERFNLVPRPGLGALRLHGGPSAER